LPHPMQRSAAMEFVFEGLHLNRRLNKTKSGDGAVYRS
jgi:hypothetical protein